MYMKLNDRNTTPFSFIKKTDKKMTSSLILAVLSVLLLGCARTFPVFAQWYSVTIYAGLKNTIARFSGLFPFSLSEAGLYLLLAFCSRTRILAKKDKINDKNFAIYLVLNLFYFGFIVSFQ